MKKNGFYYIYDLTSGCKYYTDDKLWSCLLTCGKVSSLVNSPVSTSQHAGKPRWHVSEGKHQTSVVDGSLASSRHILHR